MVNGFTGRNMVQRVLILLHAFIYVASGATLHLDGYATKDAAVVTAASSNHFSVLLGFLDSIKENARNNIPVFVYDLGLTGVELHRLSTQYSWITVRRFDFAAHPPYFDIDIARGEYAWKPVIIKEMLDSTAVQVLWLDSGDRLAKDSDLDGIFELIGKHGFLSTATSGTTQTWVHPGTRAYFNASTIDKPMCNGAIVGFDRKHSTVYQSVVVPWAACARVRACIAPPGSSRHNHRQDQAALSVLAALNGLQCSISEGTRTSQGMRPGPLKIKIHQDYLSKDQPSAGSAQAWCGGEFDADQKRFVRLRGADLCADSSATLNRPPPALFELFGNPDTRGGNRQPPTVRLDATKHSAPQPEMTVVMPVYNAAIALFESLPAVFAMTSGLWELVVILDACYDSSYDVSKAVINRMFAKSSCLRVRLIEQPSAIWETSADNLGMRISNPTRAYILIQADNIVGEHGWNERMVEQLKLSPLLFAVSARCGHSFDAVRTVGRCGPDIARPLSKSVNRSQLHITETVNRGPLLLHAHRAKALQFLDETHYYLENDEHDLNRRAAELGWIVGYLPVEVVAPLNMSARRNPEFLAFTPVEVKRQERQYEAYRIAQSVQE